MRSKRNRRLAKVAALVGAAVLLTGCARITTDLTVSENDTISGTVVVAFEDSVLESVGDDPETFYEDNKENWTANAPTGATPGPFREDGYTGVQLTYTDTPLDTFNTGNAPSGGDGAGDPIAITRKGDTFVVSGEMNLMLDGSPEGLPTSGLEATVSFTFPGEVVESNGAIDGNTVTWKPQGGEITELSATANATPESGGSLLALWIALGAVTVVGTGVAIAVVIVRRKRRAARVSGVAPAGYPVGPPQQFGPAPQYGPAPQFGPPQQFGPAPQYGPPQQYGPAQQYSPPQYGSPQPGPTPYGPPPKSDGTVAGKS